MTTAALMSRYVLLAKPVALPHSVFECDADYYAKSGSILGPLPRYEAMYTKNHGRIVL